MNRFFFTLVILISMGVNAFAQSLSPEVIASSGDNYINPQGLLSFTFGEIATETYGTANNWLTQGFQQTYSTSTGVNQQLSSGDIVVYPNPVCDRLSVDLSKTEAGIYDLAIYDLTGKLLKKNTYSQICPGQIILVELNGLANGSYFLVITNTLIDHKTVFKINKAA